MSVVGPLLIYLKFKIIVLFLYKHLSGSNVAVIHFTISFMKVDKEKTFINGKEVNYHFNITFYIV